MLGRCRRHVIVYDDGRQRNIHARAIHAYLTRDGVPPGEFLRLARADVARYPTVELREGTISEASTGAGGFTLTAADGTRLFTRKLLLATGMADEIPDLPGVEPLYGTSVHHCPYCDAWEWRDQPVAVYGRGEPASALALALRWWSPDVVLFTDGPAEIAGEHRDRLADAGIVVCEAAVTRLEGSGGLLQRVVLAGGEAVERRALFFSTGIRQRTDLAERLGCRFTEKGAVDTGKCEATNVPGLYVAGDASREAQFVTVAVAEGSEAGMTIHKALLAEELRAGADQKNSSSPSLARRAGP
jgi:thioredoxin reductase